MTTTVTNIKAIKMFFEQADSIAPQGGRRITMGEAKELTADDRAELGTLAATELGVELEKK